MAMGTPRWSVISGSGFEWEREALEFLREHLPNHDPWSAWSNFEFIGDDGTISEVDALVMSPRGLFLIEVKSRPGTLTGDAHSWTWMTDGRLSSDDNPLILANRKAKRLAGLLRRQPSVRKAHVTVPFVEPLIFLSAPRVVCRLDPALQLRVKLRGRPGEPRDDGIVAALSDFEHDVRPGLRIDAPLARVVRRAIDEAGIRPALRQRRIGDYELTKLFAEGEDWQDWEGQHIAARVRRRVRLFPFPPTGSDEARRFASRLVAREFEILQGIRHTGILEVVHFTESDRGPALVFEYDPEAVRFDVLLRHHLDRMDAALRLDLLRQLAETIKYAHEKRLFHRALSPQCILVRDIGSKRPRTQIMNWRTATLEKYASDTAGGALVRTVGTTNLADYVEDPAKVYLSPEALRGDGSAQAGADIFSLGAIAWHLFAGRPPADGPVELLTRLRERGGLRLSDTVDGVNDALADLVRFATHPDVNARISSMEEFLEYLTEAEREIRPGTTSDCAADPAAAKEGDRLDGGFTVLRRLGRGASADVFLVRRDGAAEELVLKVALDAAHDERLAAEGGVLAHLGHPNVVRHRETLIVAGRTAILMERAGEKTLAQALRDQDRPTLDLIKRYGEELLTAIEYLEDQGIAHRDIKPDNIGIAKTRSGRYTLILFDFSLSRTPADNIEAGTRPYVDPFLPLRKRWDLPAERFAAAVTLYEMLTGLLPVWGDGRSDPAALSEGAEAVIEADRFDPALRDGLSAFFERAFRDDANARFDNAEEMLRQWRRIFDDARGTVTDEGDSTFEAALRRATARTPIAEFGFSVEALDVLGRMGVHDAGQLVAVNRRQVRYLSGVGDRVRQEIRRKAKELSTRRPDVASGAALEAGAPTIDKLADQLLPQPLVWADRIEHRLLPLYIGLEATNYGEEAPARPTWLTAGEVAQHCGVARTALGTALAAARERWLKLASLNGVRVDIETLLGSNGGVMTAAELADQLLAMRGCAIPDNVERQRLASAVVRVAVEAEAGLAEPRFHSYEDEPVTLVASSIEAAIYAQALGREADALAESDPPSPPARAQDALERVTRPDGLPPITASRLLTLSVASSRSAALSARQEVYRRGMSADRALRLAVASLLGPARLSEDQIGERVSGRFPEAAPLPSRPALDTLLAAAGAGRVWWDDGPEGPGYYLQGVDFGMSTGITSGPRLMTSGPAVEEGPDVEAARRFETVLERARRQGGFLALVVEPRTASRAEAELRGRFAEFERVSLDALVLAALREEAQARNVDWSLVLRADAALPTSKDRQNLGRLVSLAMPSVEQRLRSAHGPLLLVHPGLIARFGRMEIIARLGQDGAGPTSVWLMVPMSRGVLPAIDGVPVPVIGSFQWARIPDAWTRNMHRAGSAIAAA